MAGIPVLQSSPWPLEGGISFCVPGDPVGQGRPRFARIRSGGVRTYTPPRSAQWQAEAVAAFRAAWDAPPIDELVAVDIVAVLARPKRLMRLCDDAGRMHCGVKPDVDNLAKASLDALVKAGVLRDDALVAHLLVSKFYAAKDEAPAVELTVWPASAWKGCA